MDVKLNKEIIQKYSIPLLLLIFFFLGFYIRASWIDPELTHPGNLKAANALYHSIISEFIANTGDTQNYPYFLAENHDNVFSIVSQHFAITVSSIIKITNLSNWSIAALLVSFFSALTIPLIFLIVKQLTNSEALSLLSASFLVLPTPVETWFYQMYIGLWLQAAGLTVLLISIYFLIRSFQEKTYPNLIALGVAISALFILFPIALIFILPFLLILLAFLVREKVPQREKVKKLASFMIIPLIANSLFLPIFLEGYFTNSGYSTFGVKSFDDIIQGQRVQGIEGFGIIIIVLFVLGSLQLLLNFKKYKGTIIFLLYSFALLFLLPYIAPRGITVYLIRMWVYLPILVLPIAAYGLYAIIIKNITKNIKINEILIIGIISVILIGIAIPQTKELNKNLSYENVDATKYKAFNWLATHTDPYSNVFLLEGAYQGENYYTQRNSYTVTIEELQQKVNQFFTTQTLSTDFHSGYSNAARWSLYKYRTGYYSFEQYEPLSIDVHIDDFDYVVVQNLNEPVTQYNQAILAYLIDNKGYAPVYEQDSFIIVKKPAI